jgi:hypothetical protein
MKSTLPATTMMFDQPPARASAGPIRRFYRVFRWFALAGLVVVLFLIFRPSPPPEILVTPDAAERARAKVVAFQSSVRQGRAETLEMDQSELNGWLYANLAIEKPTDEGARAPAAVGEAAMAMVKKGSAGESDPVPTVEQVQSSVRDVKIELKQESLLAYVVFDLYGMNLSLELEGRLAVQDGYLRLEPVGGKLGSLPLLAGTLQSATSRLFDAPENREKFRLPAHIRDVRIEGGRLVVISR